MKKKAVKKTVKKVTSKKAVTKTVKKVTPKKVKKEIIGKAIGRNVILIIEGKKYSKAFINKEERISILNKVHLYNENNSIKKVKEIIKIIDAPKLKKEAIKKTLPVKKKPKDSTTKVSRSVSKKAKETPKNNAKTAKRSKRGEY